MEDKLIIFDFFGVISNEISYYWMKKCFSDSDARNIKDSLSKEWDLGNITEEEMFDKLSEMTGISPDVIHKDWMDMAIINIPLVEYIKELKKNYHIVLLSNACGPFLHDILKKNNLYPLFETLIISSEVHLIKPDPEIFRLMLKRTGFDSRKAIMIDDNEINLKGAKEAGINGILYTSFEDFKRNITSYLNK